MVMRTLRAALLLGSAMIALPAFACDDDGGGEPSSTPTVAAVQTQPPQPTLTPLPTTEPGVTPQPADRIQLFASPQQLYCDGGTPSIVTARVFDANGVAVADDTPVTFEVVTLATANPINAKTQNGTAESTIVGLASGQGIVVTVSSGEAAASIRIDCL